MPDSAIKGKEHLINSSLAELLLILDRKLCKHTVLKRRRPVGLWWSQTRVFGKAKRTVTHSHVLTLSHEFLTPRSHFSVLLWQGFRRCSQTSPPLTRFWLQQCNKSHFSIVLHKTNLQTKEVTPLLHLHLQRYDQICNKQASKKQIHSLCSCFEGNI